MKPCALKLAETANVYCPELPGFGKSAKPDKVLNIQELAFSLDGFMRESKIERVFLVGHSLGCQIAAEYALHFPEKLAGLVFAAPTGNPRMKTTLPYVGKLLLDVPREPFSLIPLAFVDYLKTGLIRIWHTFQFSLNDCFEDKLMQINARALVIHGTKDPIVSESWVRKIASLLPDGQLVTIKNAGHAVNYNSPDEFALAIRKFINQVE
jgi:pimeloyl-ACP methyl ester carboxylesterase